MAGVVRGKTGPGRAGVVSFINTIFAVHASLADFMNEQGTGRAVPHHAERLGGGSKVLSPAAVEATLARSPATPTAPGPARHGPVPGPRRSQRATVHPSIASHSYSPSLRPSLAELCAVRSIEFRFPAPPSRRLEDVASECRAGRTSPP